MRAPKVFMSLIIVVFGAGLAPVVGSADVVAEASAEAKRADSSTAKTSGPQDSPRKGESTGRGGADSYEPTSEQLAAEPALRQRIKQRWEAAVKRDFEAAYAFETPMYRKEHTVEEYISGFGRMVTWHLATVKEIRYDREHNATILVALEYSFPMPNGDDARTTGFVDETWVFLDGEWWRRNDRQPLGGGK